MPQSVVTHLGCPHLALLHAGSLWTAQPNRFLVAETKDLPPGRALDLACGEGRNAVWLAERGWEVVGIDFSDVALEKARALADARSVDAQWVQADLLEFERVAVGRHESQLKG
jgi:2-polyprenyl-3-methyl-5-hydroxy-6-metoxy-1,4-benzoquinol methylase